MNKQKLLIIDGQVFQTDARDRGMGRYSARLINALVKHRYYGTIQLLLTKNSHANHLQDDDVRKMFPDVEIVYLNLHDTSRVKIETASSHNKKIINTHVSEQRNDYREIDFLIPCPFQEPIASVFPEEVKKIMVFYDLIPYLYSNRYQDKMRFDDYLKRFSLLMEADRILAISRSVKDDLSLYLGMPKDRVVSIDGAPIKSSDAPLRPGAVEIPNKYVLMPTSDDPRKNNLRAVLGFEEFRAGQNEDYKLIITSKIHSNERQRLELFSKNLIFTGNIREAELDWLYEYAMAVLFVPESEGLGLPILEAVQTGKRVICSSLNVFREISEDAFYFCEHEDQHSIAAALQRALLADELSINKTEYERILTHYSWEKTSERALHAIKSFKVRQVVKRPKIAVFTPAPDGLSAVGKVVAEAHPALSEYFNIDYYAEAGQYSQATRPNYLRHIANYYPAESFGVDMYKQYDAIFYHIGNSDYHIEAISNSLYLPGYIVLHDTNISESYRIMEERGMISVERRELEEAITAKGGFKQSRCISSVANASLGILAHSNYAKSAAQDTLARKVPIESVNLASYCPDLMPARTYTSLTIGLAGIIADIKGIEVIERIAKDPIYHDCAIRLFGFNYASQETIERLESYGNVSISTNLTDFEFQNSISKLDVFVNYRMHYQGETSLSTIEAMRQGVVTLVRDTGWYGELPDNVVVKVQSPDDLLEKLSLLRADVSKLTKISREAQLYIGRKHDYRQYAAGMLQLLDSIDPSEPSAVRVDHIKLGAIKTASQLTGLYKTSDYHRRDKI